MVLCCHQLKLYEETPWFTPNAKNGVVGIKVSDSRLFFLYFRSSSRIKLKFLVAESNVLCFHKYRRKQRNFQALLTVFIRRFRVFSLLYINFSVFQVNSPVNKSVMKFLVKFLTLCLALASATGFGFGFGFGFGSRGFRKFGCFGGFGFSRFGFG